MAGAHLRVIHLFKDITFGILLLLIYLNSIFYSFKNNYLDTQLVAFLSWPIFLIKSIPYTACIYYSV